MNKPRSSKELIEKGRLSFDLMEKVLRSNHLTAEVQESDISTICWALVEITFHLQKAVGDELFGIEGDC